MYGNKSYFVHATERLKNNMYMYISIKPICKLVFNSFWCILQKSSATYYKLVLP